MIVVDEQANKSAYEKLRESSKRIKALFVIEKPQKSSKRSRLKRMKELGRV